MGFFNSLSFKNKLFFGCAAIVIVFAIALLVPILTGSTTAGIIILIALVALSYPYVRWLERKLTEPIESISRIAMNIAKGDFTQKVASTSNDALGQLGDSFNQMIEKLREILGETSNISKHVSDVSRDIFLKNQNLQEVFSQVSSSTNELATGANEISENVHEISASIKDIESKVSGYAESTRAMNERSKQTIQLVDKGRTAVEAQNDGMKRNIVATAAVSETISALAKQAEGITKITRTISELAEQTNLLSLNASIEAARAGEHGQGFAVVAHEVRKLAEESGSSAKEVFNLVRSIEVGIREAITNIEQNEEVVQRQSELIQETEKVFAEIVQGVQFIADQIYLFSQESEQMLDSAKNISSGMENISAITEEAAAGTEQVSASMNEQISSVQAILEQSEQMAAVVSRLQRTIQIFKL